MDADDWNSKGQQALDDMDMQLAVDCFTKAIGLEPDWSVPHYNLGLTHKLLKNWEESRLANLQAHRLNPEDNAAKWNLAISATAVGHWESVEVALKGMGLDVPDAPGPWEYRLGLTPIRVNPEEAPEVVWAHRIDPVRACLANVPFPQCGRRFGDIVLHDGAPNGYRKLGEREVPVFDELMVLEQSELRTFELILESQSTEDLMAILEEHNLIAENWTNSVQFLCRACSEGRPHEQHDHDLLEPADDTVRLGVAATELKLVEDALLCWTAGRVKSVKLVL